MDREDSASAIYNIYFQIFFIKIIYGAFYSLYCTACLTHPDSAPHVVRLRIVRTSKPVVRCASLASRSNSKKELPAHMRDSVARYSQVQSIRIKSALLLKAKNSL